MVQDHLGHDASKKPAEWPKVDGFTVLLIHHAPSDPGSLILIWMQQKWNIVKTTWIMRCI